MITIRKYKEEDDVALRELSKLSQKGDITFSIFREPSFIAGAHIQTETVIMFVILKDDTIIGCFNMGHKELYYHGKREDIRYCCDVKIARKYQNGSALIRIVSKTYEIMKEDKVPTQLIMFAENDKILRIVKGRKKKGRDLKIFHGHEIGQMRTTLIDRKNKIKKSGTCKINRGSEADIKELQNFINREASKIDFFPHYELSELGNPFYKDLKIENFYIARKEGEIVGTFAIWDLMKVKQTVIMGYSRKYKLARPFYNLYARVMGIAKLVRKGEAIRNRYISCLLVEERDKVIYEEMLGYVLEERKGEDYHYLLSTLDVRDPLGEVHGKLTNKREIGGEYYVGDMNPEGGEYCSAAYFYLEAARL